MTTPAATQPSVSIQKEIKFGPIPAGFYFVCLGIVLLSSYLKVLPGGWLGAFTFCTLVGYLLEKIGDNVPIVKDYLGGGAIVMIFGGALMVYWKVFPEQTLGLVNDFVTKMDYLGWVVGGLICGSILSMDRKLLIRAGALYFVPLLAGVAVSFALVGVIGAVIGYGWRQAIMFVALPIMGGGTAAGAVPTSQIYGTIMHKDPKFYLSMLMPAVALGNALAIVSAGLLDKVGKLWPETTGNGVLMRNFEVEKKKEPIPDYEAMGVGFLITGVFYAVGRIISLLVPAIHYYAWTIITVGVVKALGLFPERYNSAVQQWYNFMVKISIPAVLIGIGAAYTDLGVVIAALNWQYLLLCVATVLGAIIGTWVVGKWVGFYPIESAITAGLCMANMGGSGDVATLGAAHRMELMPFAQISSRIGGAIILVIASILASTIGQAL